MATEPRVSVFIACYNHARYLPECLDSILAQTFRDFEIVIVDDGSTDNSLAIMQDYQRQYPDIVRVYFHPGHANKGVSASSNLALAMSRGEYLAWTGSDDVWYAERLALEVARLEQNPAAGMVYSYADYIDSDGKTLPGRAGNDISSDPNPVGQMLQYCHLPAMTVLIRRNCLESVGPFDENLRTCEDWDLWIRVFSRWRVEFVAQSLVKYRLHRSNLSKGVDPKIYLSHVLAFYRRLEQKLTDIAGPAQAPRNKAIFHLQLVLHLFASNELSEAVTHINAAFACDPGLSDDIKFLDSWLNQWKPDFYSTENRHFGLWFAAQVPEKTAPELRDRLFRLLLRNPDTKAFYVERGVYRGRIERIPVDINTIFNDCPDVFTIPLSWQEDVLKKVYASLLFESYKAGDRIRTRMYWRRAVQSDWNWIANRGVLTIGLKTLLAGRN